MLRLRRVHRDGHAVWQASVESPHTGERHAFASVEALLAFLEQKMLSGAGEEPQGDGLSAVESVVGEPPVVLAHCGSEDNGKGQASGALARP